MFKPYLITTAHQKILDFFITHPEQSFYGVELSNKIKLSIGRVNKVLKDFQQEKILEKTRRGRTDLYSLKDNQPIIKQLKIISTILRLELLIDKLKPLAHKIILYGSSSQGTNDYRSDIDLLIVTTKANKPSAENEISRYQKQQTDLPKIQAAIKTTAQWSGLEDNDPTYFKEVLEGIILWDRLKSYEED